jgi:hypothetical protein
MTYDYEVNSKEHLLAMIKKKMCKAIVPIGRCQKSECKLRFTCNQFNVCNRSIYLEQRAKAALDLFISMYGEAEELFEELL